MVNIWLLDLPRSVSISPVVNIWLLYLPRSVSIGLWLLFGYLPRSVSKTGNIHYSFHKKGVFEF